MIFSKPNPLHMPSIEERVETLETLLKVLIKDLRETRDSISKGFQKIDDNFDQIHSKIDNLSGSTDSSFGQVDFTLQSIKEEIEKINTVTGYEKELNNLTIIQGGKS